MRCLILSDLQEVNLDFYTFKRTADLQVSTWTPGCQLSIFAFELLNQLCLRAPMCQRNRRHNFLLFVALFLSFKYRYVVEMYFWELQSAQSHETLFLIFSFKHRIS